MNEILRVVLNLPKQASTLARGIDQLHYFVILVTMGGAVGVSLLAAYFLFKYRRTNDQAGGREGGPDLARSPPGAARRLEFLIIGTLLGLFILWWVIGFRQYMALSAPPSDSMDVYVTGKKWMWEFRHPDGSASIGALYVPARRPVRLLLGSRDVIHSFFIPEFRIKQDAVPGRTTIAWFEAKEPGVYSILCAEYCGAGHSTMRAEVVVLPEAEFERMETGRWALETRGPEYAEPAVAGRTPRQPLSLAAMGERAAVRHGCLRCHTVDGTPHIGPTWLGMYGATVVLQDGSRALADPAYITESIMDPIGKVHAGFPTLMPSYQGRIGTAEMGALLEFMKSLRHAPRVREEERWPRR